MISSTITLNNTVHSGIPGEAPGYPESPQASSEFFAKKKSPGANITIQKTLRSYTRDSLSPLRKE